jgi:hypothetical protein
VGPQSGNYFVNTAVSELAPELQWFIIPNLLYELKNPHKIFDCGDITSVLKNETQWWQGFQFGTILECIISEFG